MKVILGKSNTLGSWAIRVFTWSNWSHCGAIVNDVVYESSASEGGVVKGSLSYFKKRYPKHIIIDIPHIGDFQRRLIEQLGKPYDWGGIVKFVFRRDWSNPNKWFCSEYVAHASGIFNPKFTDRVSPQDILKVGKEIDG